MAKIIKAGQVKFNDKSDGPTAEIKSFAIADQLSQELPGSEPDPGFDASLPEAPQEPQDPDAEVMHAYEELIHTAQDEVAAMLREARDEAQITLRDAERQADDIRQNAYDEGYNMGLQKAHDETAEVVRKAEKDAADLIERAKAEHDAILQEEEPKLLKLALDAAEKILRYELDRDDKAYMSILSNALNAAKAESGFTVHINPEDYKKYFDEKDEAKIQTPKGEVPVLLYADPSVEKGGSLIDTDSGAIDTSPEAQIGRLASGIGLEAI